MSKQNKVQQNDLTPYRTFGLTLLQLMGLLAVAGIAATVILHMLFG